VTNIEQLKRLAAGLYELLNNPETGIAAWHQAVHQKIDEIAAFHEDEDKS